MTANSESRELRDRLDLIESMIAEGRRSTERWGWVFVLWGVAYYVAILWTSMAHSRLAWPVTMIAAVLLTWGMLVRKGTRRPATTMSRAIGAVWTAMGASTFILLMSLGLSGRIDEHIEVAAIAAMLAVANAASSLILRWKLQFACAVVWWVATVYGCFGSGHLVGISFLAAIFVCQIAFGAYMMICESRGHRRGAVHA